MLIRPQDISPFEKETWESCLLCPVKTVKRYHLWSRKKALDKQWSSLPLGVWLSPSPSLEAASLLFIKCFVRASELDEGNHCKQVSLPMNLLLNTLWILALYQMNRLQMLSPNLWNLNHIRSFSLVMQSHGFCCYLFFWIHSKLLMTIS